jgi:poly(A) polymerase
MSHARSIAAAVAKQLQAHGFLGVFAGGCVRDRFLGVEPKDFDVATNATPEQIKRIFAEDHCLFVGEAFGVIVVVRQKVQVEVATLRNDGQYGDSRRPDSVVFLTDCDWREALKGDAARRDLTINAMFEDPMTGEIFDFFGGRDDIKNRIIRSVGDPVQRFKEDRLRMLRVVRFAAKLGFKVDAALMSALKQFASQLQPGGIVAWERIRDEVKGVLLSKAPLVGLDLLMETGLMAEILPEMMPMRSFKGFQDPYWHPEGTAWEHTRQVVNASATREGMAEKLAAFVGDEYMITGIAESRDSFALRLALLLHDIAKPRTQTWKLARRTVGPRWKQWLLPFRIRVSNHGHAEQGAEMAAAICRRLKLPGETTSRVKEIVLMHMQMHDFDDPKIKRSKLFRLMNRADVFDLIVMQHCDSLGTGRPKAERMGSSLMAFYLNLMAEMRNDPVASKRPGAVHIVNGEHILAHGFKRGPLVGVIKEAALEAQLAGEFTDESGGLEWLKRHAEQFRASGADAAVGAVSTNGSKHCC